MKKYTFLRYCILSAQLCTAQAQTNCSTSNHIPDPRGTNSTVTALATVLAISGVLNILIAIVFIMFRGRDCIEYSRGLPRYFRSKWVKVFDRIQKRLASTQTQDISNRAGESQVSGDVTEETNQQYVIDESTSQDNDTADNPMVCISRNDSGRITIDFVHTQDENGE